MRIWSILLIKSDLKWCIHLSRSLYSYFILLSSSDLQQWPDFLVHDSGAEPSEDDNKTVYKCGRTTGITTGTLANVIPFERLSYTRDGLSQNVNVQMHDVMQIKGQWNSNERRFDDFADAGDSGAAVFTCRENWLKPIGMIFGFNTRKLVLATPINSIMQELAKQEGEHQIQSFISRTPNETDNATASNTEYRD